MAELYLIGENEYQLRKNEVVLSSLEWEKIIEHSKVIIKLLQKVKFNYQIELMKGTHRKREEILYDKMEAMDEVIKSIESMETWMIKYQEAEEIKRKQKEEEELLSNNN